MTETELIDALNELSAVDLEFRGQLQESVANQDFGQIRKLVYLVIEHSQQSISPQSIDRVIAWFFD